MTMTYFAADGSFGSAENLIIINTSRWTEADWDAVLSLPDDERAGWAEKLNELLGEGE